METILRGTRVIRWAAFVGLGFVISPLAAPLAEAIPIVDQELVVTDGTSGPGVSFFQFPGQTFTVGIDGILTGVEVQVWKAPFNTPTDPLTLHILPLDADGSPTEDFGSALGFVDVAASDIPLGTGFDGRFTFFDLSSFSIDVAAGDMLAIALSTTAPSTSSAYAWVANTPSTPDYTGGAEWVFNPGSDWRRSVTFPPDTPLDLGFRTYVEPAVVDPGPDPAPMPEPSSLVLFGAALAGFGWKSRRRRASPVC